MPSYKEQFNLNIFDHSSVGYCVLELVLDDKGQPVDWICSRKLMRSGYTPIMGRHMRTGPVKW